MKKLFSNIQLTLTQLEKRIGDTTQFSDICVQFQTSLQSIEKFMSFQTKKLTDLEDRSRRSNLVIYGVAESPDETEQLLKEKVEKEVFNDKLNVKVESIGRIHMLGKKSGKRPVIV